MPPPPGAHSQLGPFLLPPPPPRNLPPQTFPPPEHPLERNPRHTPETTGLSQMGEFHRPWTLPTVKKISGFLRWPVQRTPTEQPHVVSGVLPIGDFDPSCTLPGLKISGLWWACSVDNHLNKPMVQNSSCHSRGTKESSLSMQTPRHPSAHGKSPPKPEEKMLMVTSRTTVWQRASTVGIQVGGKTSLSTSRTATWGTGGFLPASPHGRPDRSDGLSYRQSVPLGSEAIHVQDTPRLPLRGWRACPGFLGYTNMGYTNI